MCQYNPVCCVLRSLFFINHIERIKGKCEIRLNRKYDIVSQLVMGESTSECIIGKLCVLMNN